MVAAMAVLWGTIGPIVREVDLPAVAIVASRVWFASVALAVWLAWCHRRNPDFSAPTALLSHRPARVLANGAVLAVHWVALFAALQRAPVGTVLLITYLAPVGVAALAKRTLGEQATRRTLLALGVALLGVALVAGPSVGRADGDGVVLACVAAALYVVVVLVAKPLSSVYGGPRLAFLQFSAAGVVLIPFAAQTGWGSPSASWLWLLVLGLVHTALAVGVYLGALALLPATQVGVLSYLEPASAVVFGWLLLAEAPTPLTLVGGVLIAVAGVVVLAQPEQAPVPIGEGGVVAARW